MWLAGTALQRALASTEIARRTRDLIYARLLARVSLAATRERVSPTERRAGPESEPPMQRLGIRNGIHVQRPDITGYRTTGLRGIGASGMPLIPLEYCQTPKCKGKPVVRATDRDTRLAFCLVCWPMGNA